MTTDGTERDDGRKRGDRGIFERPKGSGVWYARYRDEHGRLHREKVGPKGLALKVYQKRRTEITERRFFPERIRRPDILVSVAIDDYLVRLKGRSRSYRNWDRCGKVWKAALGNKTLREVLPGDIERFRARRRGEGLAPASVNRELSFLRSVFNAAIEDEKIEKNPVRSKFLSKEANQHVRYLTQEEEVSLRAAIGEAEWPKVAVALLTGLRQGNQFHLAWADVHFDTGIIRARQSKSGEDYFIPMNEELRAILRALPSRLRSAWVFPSETGETPLDAKNHLHRAFLPALRRAGVRDFRWHDLRHTFASRLVMAGVDIRTVQELLGHKTLTMTMRYAHLSPAHKLEAVQRLSLAPSSTTGSTDDASVKIAVEGGAEVRNLPPELSEPCRDRTGDPLLKRQLLYQLS